MMFPIRFNLLLMALVFVFGTRAQDCYTDALYQKYLAENPNLKSAMNDLQNLPSQGRLYKKAGIKIIPVVFHVIHDYGIEKLDLALIRTAVKNLNNDYRKKNSDTTNTRALFKPFAADMEIEFRLASLDPEGNCTQGVNYVQSKMTYYGGQNVKSLIRWDNTRYLNIWVVNELYNPKVNLAGFAQYPGPSGGPDSSDGVVVAYRYVGNNPGNRVLTHEIGHWMGLYHIFFNDCFGSGDHIDDTPPQTNNGFYSCATPSNTCNYFEAPFTEDPPDMYENFMDYSASGCSNLFTQGQKSRAHQCLALYRSNLFSPANLTLTGTGGNGPVSCAPVADFSFSSLRACEGTAFSFKDVSYNAVVQQRNWTFEQASPSAGTAANPTNIVWNKAGTYRITLVVSNTQGSDTLTRGLLVLPRVSPVKTPFYSGFEDPDLKTQGWSLEEGGNKAGWEHSGSYRHWGNFGMFIHHFSETLPGETDAFYSQAFDLSGLTKPVIRFYTAYAQRYASVNDALRVYVSKDCGLSWQLKLAKAGANLSGGVNISPEDYFPKPEDWRLQQIDLSSFAAETSVMFRFETQGNNGNNLFLDDVQIGEESSLFMQPVPTGRELWVVLIPNPGTEKARLQIYSGTPTVLKITVSDELGREVQSGSDLNLNSGMNEIPLPSELLKPLSPGVYYIRCEWEGGTRVLKWLRTE